MEITDKTAKRLRNLKPFKSGAEWTGNKNGRPKDSISIKDRIRQRLQENPDEFENLVEFYLKDKKMRDLLWKMLEGLPKQSVDNTGEININLNFKQSGFKPKISAEGISDGSIGIGQEIQDRSIS